MQVLSIRNNEKYNHVQSFKAYTAKQICGELCKGACCNIGTPTSASFKTVTDALWVQSRIEPTDPKNKSLIQRTILKWMVNSDNPHVLAANGYANACIEAILKEKNKFNLMNLKTALNALNKMLCELLGEKELFFAVTNPDAVDLTADDFIDNEVKNICMYKDNRTNFCTIYNGVEDENGNKIERPSACLKLGGPDWPCLWLSPEKLKGICLNIASDLANRRGVELKDIDTNEVIQRVTKAYKLNNDFWVKIWEPFIKNKEADL